MNFLVLDPRTGTAIQDMFHFSGDIMATEVS